VTPPPGFLEIGQAALKKLSSVRTEMAAAAARW